MKGIVSLYPRRLAVLWLLAAVALYGQTPAAFVDRYCRACHNERAKVGGLVLSHDAASDPAAHAEIWEKVLRRVSSGEMPPAGLPRPSKPEIDSLREQLLAALDAPARSNPYAARTVIRRLNRLEYGNAIRDLLAIELPVAAELPPDGMAGGFDNIADALSMSPLLLEQYLKVARRVSRVAAGVGDPSPVTETFAAGAVQSTWAGEGMPFGSRGGIRVKFYFPFNGAYSLRAFVGRDGLPHPEGVRFFQTRVSLPAGSHTVVVTFPDEYAEREGPVPNVAGAGGPALGGPLDVRGSAIRPTIEFRVDSKRIKLFEMGGISVGDAAFGGQPGPATLDRIEISGPFEPEGVGDTPSKRRIFICRPTAHATERSCANRILSTIARRAFRREVSPTDVRPYMSSFTAARRRGGFDVAIAAALRDILLAPDFLFRLEFDPRGAAPGSVRPVSDTELASRLSFFLWSSIPDDQLLNVARAGQLRNSVVLDRQIRRLLNDSRATAMIDNFVEQWLGLRGLSEVKPDRKVYPQYDGALATNFQQETRLFLRSLFRENRSAVDVLAAPYSYLNERLADVYGVTGVVGSGFRRVSFPPDSPRGGLLGQGSVLMLTSHSSTTSPILRGKWILDNLLNEPPPPPPPGIPPLNESPENGRKLTTRQQVERHRKDPVCASCHSRMDPLGFALESFDVIGRFRTTDDGGPIDSSGKLASGETFSGPRGLKQFLLNHPDDFVDATVSRLLTYAVGRQLDARDRPAIRRIMKEAKANGYRLQDLIVEIVKSVPFQMKQAPVQENPS